jgi:3-deoxy-alpha-D-manno-octulosonate 8-oxidase
MSKTSTLDTGIRNARNVSHYLYGFGSITDLKRVLADRRSKGSGQVVFFVDSFFEKNGLPANLDAIGVSDTVIYVDATNEPSTTLVNEMRDQLFYRSITEPSAIVGIGGGSTMDVAKAVANLLTNEGNAEDYQGWDLVRTRAIWKVGIPTISGTGAESTRTCVMINPANGLKLGMNSDFTVYDQIILDPYLTRTVPRDQYFYTGIDAWVHCVESLSGSYRNAIGDAYSAQTITLCKNVFDAEDMMSDEHRAKLMVASYLGGCAIATSYVGVIHPFSAALSVVLGTHHCIANCIAMRAMEEFYPEAYQTFWTMVDRQGVNIPEGICRNLTDEQYERLYASSIIHEKPLTNALGKGFREILTKEKAIEIFKRM